MPDTGSLNEDANSAVEARFTPKEGLAGWLLAVRRRQPLYGSGWAEPATTGLRLYGWRRTWLGIGERAEITVTRDKIRNVAVDGSILRFDIRGLFRRAYSLELPSPDAAETLAKTLPEAKTPLFERHWRDLRDYNRKAAETAPITWVTFLLLLLCVAMFAAQVILAGRIGPFDITQAIALGALSGPLVQTGQAWRLISSAFLHANLLHLVLNMWVLVNIGRLTERLLGSPLLLLVYLCCAVLASAGSLLWAPAMVSVGASGAIYGLFGVFLAHLLVRRTVIPAILLRAHWLSTLLFVLLSLTSGFLQDGTNNAAHVAGLLSGLALGAVLAWRPLEHSPGRRAIAATAVSSLLLAACWQVGSPLWKPAAEWVAFKQSYDWLATGETDNLSRWAALDQKVALRRLGGQEAAEAYRTEIAPFWQDAEKKLYDATGTSTGEFQAVWRVLAAYAHSRADLLDATAAYMEKPLDPDRETRGQMTMITMNHASARMNTRIARDDAAFRARGLSEFPLPLRLAQLIGGGCVQEPEEARFEGDFGPAGDAPAIAVAAECQAQRDFQGADFAALETRLAAYSATLADLADGSSSLDGVTAGLGELFDNRSGDFQRHMTLLADWRRQFPESVWPDLLEARLMVATAWTARGHGAARDVLAQNQQLYIYYQGAAVEILRETMTRAAGNRYWYELDVGAQNDLGEDRGALEEAYREGAAMFPLDLRLHVQMLRARMPRWGGSVEEIEETISKAYAKTAAKAGMPVYSRLYWSYADLEGESVDIFTASAADWDLMRNGFRDMAKQHPDSDFVANAYARFACLAQDADEYRRIRPRLNGHPSPTAWPPGLSAASCDKRMDAVASR